jgi:anthranilate phosphoribosyltransferase
VAEVREGTVRTFEITPEEFGMKRATIDALAGGGAAENAGLIRRILEGEKSPRRDVVVMNAAAALAAAGEAEHLAGGAPLATQSIDSGAALAKLEALIRFTNQAA